MDGFINDDNIIRRFDSVEDFKKVHKNLNETLSLNTSVNSLNSTIERIVCDYKLYKYTKESGELSELEKKIINIIYHNNHARVHDISNLLNTSIDLTIRLLTNLVDKKILAKRIDGRHIFYTIAL